MSRYFRLPPLFFAALGAAAGFYFLFKLSLFTGCLVIFLSLVALCFFRVLSSAEISSRCLADDSRRRLNQRFLRIAHHCSTALSLGLALGLCAAYAGRTGAVFSLPPERISAVEGILLEDPRIISGGRAVAVLSLKRCATAADSTARSDSRGQVTVFFPQDISQRLREAGRGTTVFAEGSLRQTETGWTFSASSMHIVEPASAIERLRTGIRLDLLKRFEGKQWGGLSLALLLGIKDNLDSELSAMYRDAGCSFILALSGMHLAVLAAIIAFLLKKPLGLKAAAIAGALIIILYCFIVGPLPSLNRAALMYLLGAIAILGFLPAEPLCVLCLSFLIQIVITPDAGFSISFILSYLALAGILIITPHIYSLFAGKVPDFLLKPLSASCGAFLSTAGVTGFSFGVIVPAGIITALFLVPLTTLFMIGSLIWLVLDLLSLSAFFSIPLSFLYRLMESIVSIAAGIGRISTADSRLLSFLVLALSLLLALSVIIIEYRQREQRQRIKTFS